MGAQGVGDYFREDCRVFLAKFKKKNSLRFDAFAEVWQEMKFSYILCPWKYMGEMLDFVDEFLKISKRIWLRSEELYQRVCGLYLMRAIYLKQPAQQYMKISLSYDDWQLMKQFLYVIKDFEHNETRYILQELFDLNAFTISVPDFTEVPGDSISKLCEDSPVAHFNKARKLYTELFAWLKQETSEYNEQKKACAQMYPELDSYSTPETDNLLDILMGKLKVFSDEVGKIQGDLDKRHSDSATAASGSEAASEEMEKKTLKRKRCPTAVGLYVYGESAYSTGSEEDSDDGTTLDMPQLVESGDSDGDKEDEVPLSSSAAAHESDLVIHLSDFELSSASSDDDECSPKRETVSGNHPSLLDFESPDTSSDKMVTSPHKPTTSGRKRRPSTRSKPLTVKIEEDSRCDLFVDLEK